MRAIGMSLVLALATAIVASAQPPETAVPAFVSLVIDGDTVVLRNGEHVRYLGINTPEEGEPFYWAAKVYNRRLVWRKTVYLEIGPEHRDGYGRLLAYIWVKRGDEWILVNEAILRRGLAKLLVIWPDQYYERLLRALTLAQVDKLGLWGKYKEPLPLAAIEEDPEKYVTEAVTVDFTAGEVRNCGQGVWCVYAAGSRFGFHLLVHEEVLAALGLSPEKLPGEALEVTGELRWENRERGPYIEVIIPEQWGKRG